MLIFCVFQTELAGFLCLPEKQSTPLTTFIQAILPTTTDKKHDINIYRCIKKVKTPKRHVVCFGNRT